MASEQETKMTDRLNHQKHQVQASIRHAKESETKHRVLHNHPHLVAEEELEKKLLQKTRRTEEERAKLHTVEFKSKHRPGHVPASEQLTKRTALEAAQKKLHSAGRQMEERRKSLESHKHGALEQMMKHKAEMETKYLIGTNAAFAAMVKQEESEKKLAGSFNLGETFQATEDSAKSPVGNQGTT